jgi:hypothetical protein
MMKSLQGAPQVFVSLSAVNGLPDEMEELVALELKPRSDGLVPIDSVNDVRSYEYQNILVKYGCDTISRVRGNLYESLPRLVNDRFSSWF